MTTFMSDYYSPRAAAALNAKSQRLSVVANYSMYSVAK